VTARPLPGKDLAAAERARTAEAVAALADGGVAVRLAVVTATRDESAAWYVRSLAGAAGRMGIACDVTDLGADAEPGELERTVAALSADPAVHGIILQTPLPASARPAELASVIDPAKDVDGASPVSLGRLAAGLPAFAPATAAAVLALLDFHGIGLAGRRAVVVGRSAVVGKPLALLLLARDATVTVCHSRTRDLADVTRTAEILVAAAGKPGLITAEHVRPGAIVIDVGTSAADGRLAGDVDAASVTPVAGALSPVPGGVGPVTTALLLASTASAASGDRGICQAHEPAPDPHGNR
jgi:methylenetetrahydrofolate dehydrogenase (NADP+) / methenyltetrahydrofolate cyclohydrolase